MWEILSFIDCHANVDFKFLCNLMVVKASYSYLPDNLWMLLLWWHEVLQWDIGTSAAYGPIAHPPDDTRVWRTIGMILLVIIIIAHLLFIFGIPLIFMMVNKGQKYRALELWTVMCVQVDWFNTSVFFM
jgi:hypothetical protein